MKTTLGLTAVLATLALTGGCSKYLPPDPAPGANGTAAGGSGSDGQGGTANDGATGGDGGPATADGTGSAGGACATVEQQLDGVWITPEDAVVDPNGFYASLTLMLSSHSGEVAQYASGQSMITPIAQWQVQGSNCDEVHWDYGDGWMTEYSVINELTDTTLEMVATDGSYYGMTSRYRHESGGGGGTGGGGTCENPCDQVTPCDPGQSCLSTTQGDQCMPAGCASCFQSQQLCQYQADTCEFTACVPPSGTCGDACDPANMMTTCESPTTCMDTGNGAGTCLPPDCSTCVPAGQQCVFTADTCEFAGCQ